MSIGSKTPLGVFKKYSARTLRRWIEWHNQLLKLDEVLTDSQKIHDFDMRNWGDPRTDSEGHMCGTSACLGGWAAQQPWFKARGFELRFEKRPTLYPATRRYPGAGFRWRADLIVDGGQISADGINKKFGPGAVSELFESCLSSAWTDSMRRVRSRRDRLRRALYSLPKKARAT